MFIFPPRNNDDKELAMHDEHFESQNIVDP